MQLQKINNIKVKPIISGSGVDIEKIRGNKLFPSKNPAIFLLGKRMSGKTSTIGEILKKCAGKKSIIHFYVSTLYQDDTYKEIIKMLKNKGITNIEKNTNIDNLEELVDELCEQYKEDDDEKELKGSGKKEKVLQMKYIMVDEDDEEEEKKEPKDRKITPPHIFIFDDMSHALRSPIISRLVKNGRHFCMILLSSQNLNDLQPDTILQLSYCLMFPQIPKEKLLETHRKMDLSIPVNKFLELYYFATNEPYHFLYVASKGAFRKDFNYEFKDF